MAYNHGAERRLDEWMAVITTSQTSFSRCVQVQKIDLNVTRYPSIGFNSMCIYHEEDEMCTSFVTDGLNTDSEIFPTLWKISHIIYISGFCISAIATLMSISTCRFQILFNKNIHNATGCLQALAGNTITSYSIIYNA